MRLDTFIWPTVKSSHIRIDEYNYRGGWIALQTGPEGRRIYRHQPQLILKPRLGVASVSGACVQKQADHAGPTGLETVNATLTINMPTLTDLRTTDAAVLQMPALTEADSGPQEVNTDLIN